MTTELLEQPKESDAGRPYDKVFKSLIHEDSDYTIHSISQHQLNYHTLLFSWLDKDENIIDPYPFKCRGLINIAFYDPKVRANFHNYESSYQDFEPVRDKFQMILFFPTNLAATISKRVSDLNDLKELINLNEDEKLSLETPHKIYNNLDGWSALKLCGPAAWQSAAPLVGFILGYIRSGADEFLSPNMRAPGNVKQSLINWLTAYSKTIFCTKEIDNIVKYWDTDIEKLTYLGFAHDFGAAAIFFIGANNGNGWDNSNHWTISTKKLIEYLNKSENKPKEQA